MIDSEAKKHIADLNGTPGFRAMQWILEQQIASLDSVSNLNEDSDIGVEALANKKAVRLLRDFLNDINVLPKKESETRKTYE